jgi:hypothetical protein
VRSGPGKTVKKKKKKRRRRRKKYSGQQQKEIDCDEPHPAPNEKTKPIQWTERSTGALVAVNSLWPGMAPCPTGLPHLWGPYTIIVCGLDHQATTLFV